MSDVTSDDLAEVENVLLRQQEQLDRQHEVFGQTLDELRACAAAHAEVLYRLCEALGRETGP